jgi:Grx4 family monothiol glutaredoxin
LTRPEIKLTSGKGLADLTVPLSTIIDAVVKQNKARAHACLHIAMARSHITPHLAPQVVAFIKGTRSAPECGFSKRMVLNLEECGVDYEVVNVLDATYNPGLREEIKTYSAWPTIPQLYAHGEFLGGADITADMHEKGELKPTLAGAKK